MLIDMSGQEALAMYGVFQVALVLGYIFFAFIPYWIARSRNHKQAVPILLTALFFPFAGWVIALIWATMSGDNQGGRVRDRGRRPRGRVAGARPSRLRRR